MKGIIMYSKIQQCKEDGLNKSQASRELGVSRGTIRRYWDMSLESYEKLHNGSKRRKRKLDSYQKYMLHLLFKHNEYKSSQILDLMKERYPEQAKNFKYSTVNREVKLLRQEHNVPKCINKRQYQAVQDLPLGYQAQVDVGFTVQNDIHGNFVKLSFIAMVLSRSRYKYVEWFLENPTAFTLLKFHNNAFDYLGGCPEEIVYDQDRTLVTNENFGDIIYTMQFENYRQQQGFNTYICRGFDPETKGKIESVVKYVKDNFASHREFLDLPSFNQECRDWLVRTANAKVHGTTKKVPAEVFSLEKKFLKPIPGSEIKSSISKEIISRKVRKDNTIEFKANRYSLPLNTYKPGRSVNLVVENEKIKIYSQEDKTLIASHRLSIEKGRLIQNSNHLRDHSQKVKKLFSKTLSLLGSSSEAELFLSRIKTEKPRYVRDQFNLITRTVKCLTEAEIQKTVEYCLNNELYSATVFASVAENLFEIEKRDFPRESINIPASYEISINDRDLSEYERLVTDSD